MSEPPYLPTSIADLEAAGIARTTARGPRWRRTSHGFLVPAGGDPRDPLTRVVESIPVVPSQGAFTGWVAALLAGCTDLDGIDPLTMTPLPVPIVTGAHTGRWPRTGVVAIRTSTGPLCHRRVRVRRHTGELDTVDVPTTDALTTALHGVSLAGDLTEAVAFVDALAHGRWLDLHDLSGAADARQGRRGVRLLRRVAGLADAAARNTWESRLRILYIEEAGLPRPRCNVPIFDRRGRLLGIADLLDEDAGLVTEFDGAGHRLREQHRHDNVREEGFEGVNLRVTRADSLDMLRHRDQLITRLVRGYERGVARDRSRDAWTTRVPDEWGADFPRLSDRETADLLGRWPS